MSQVIVNLFSGLAPLCIPFSHEALVTVKDLKSVVTSRTQIPPEDQRLATLSGRPLYDEALLFRDNEDFLTVNLKLRLSGGKGGFGSMLRAQGGKMASQKTTNFEACRDLNGRRLRTINEAKKLADYLEKEPERLRVKAEKIEKKIKDGIREPPMKKHRFDDVQYLNQSQEIIEDVKESVNQAMKAKKQSSKKISQKNIPTSSLSMWDIEMSDYDSSEGEGSSVEEDSTVSNNKKNDVKMSESSEETEQTEAPAISQTSLEDEAVIEEPESGRGSKKSMKGKAKVVKGKGNAIALRKRKTRAE